MKKRKISQEALKRTTRCQYQYACLHAESHPKCPAERKIEGNGLFLKSGEQKGCPYAMSWGYGHICNCPIRVELFVHHNI
jgi:hypothetical protein